MHPGRRYPQWDINRGGKIKRLARPDSPRRIQKNYMDRLESCQFINWYKPIINGRAFTSSSIWKRNQHRPAHQLVKPGSCAELVLIGPLSSR